MTITYKTPETGHVDTTNHFADLQRKLAAQPTRLWHRIALGGIFVLSAFFTFYQVSLNGYGNLYYVAAVKSMLDSWHNFFFVSFDPGGFVTVDKPPLGLWIEALSAKIFGFSGFSLLLPQALAGLFGVLILYHLVRRSFGPIAGLISALVLGLTPISLVMSRDNNQDMLMVFFLLLATWCAILATERGKLRWLLLCAINVALAFNIKTLEAYLLVPAFGLLYLLGAPIGWGKRIGHLALACVLMLVLSLAWLVAVDLTPASQRPYVGSSQDNSEISLALGYNGLQRLVGSFGGGGSGGSGNSSADRRGPTSQESSAGRSSISTNPSASTQRPTSGNFPAQGGFPGGGSGGPTQGGTSRGGNGGPAQGGFPGGGGTRFSNGTAGPLRLFDADLGGQAGWFIPLALIGMIALAWQSRLRLPLSRSHQTLVVWGLWFLVNAAFFCIASFFHPYYLVIIAPPIAALSGIALVLLWYAYREQPISNWRSWVLPLGLLLTAAGQIYILQWYQSWSFLTPVILVVCLLAAVILALVKFIPRLNIHAAPLPKAAVSLALVALLVTPLIWSYISDQASTAGALPSAGPSAMNANFARAFNPEGGAAGTPSNFTGGRQGGGGGRGGPGGSGAVDVNSTLLNYLEANQGSTKFLFATASAQTAAPYIIQTGKAVMAMGGFSGGDPILTAQSLATLVKNNTVRFFLISSGGPGGFGGQPGATPTQNDTQGTKTAAGGGFGQSSSATSWVQQNCTVVATSKWETSGTSSTGGFGGRGGGQQLYDCASAR
ncbi:MAG TPA: glycosyltransferase family 39 protein [Ktedonobacteraceae bacterium]